MAKLEVGDNLLEGEAGVRDARVASDWEPLVDPMVMTATAWNCPSGSQLDLELPAGMYLAEGQRQDREALDAGFMGGAARSAGGAGTIDLPGASAGPDRTVGFDAADGGDDGARGDRV